jgi:hypothetical protein
LIGEEGRKRQVSERKLGGDTLLAGLCRMPASTSPLRKGDALAISVLRSGNV